MHRVERDLDGYVLADYYDEDPAPVVELGLYRIRRQQRCARSSRGHSLQPLEDGAGAVCKKCRITIFAAGL